MSDVLNFASEDRPSYADLRIPAANTTARENQDHEHEHEHELEHEHESGQHTESSSLSEDKSSPRLLPSRSRGTSHSRSRRSRRTSTSSADTDPLEPLELALSGTQHHHDLHRTRSAATGTSAWSRPPEYEVTFEDDDSPLRNPKDWPFWYRMWVIFCVSYSTWVVVLYSTSYTAAIPGLEKTFKPQNETIANLGITTYLLGLAAGSLIVAPLSELFGRRWVYLICLSISVLLIIPCALATSLAGIIVVRFFGALFGAVMVCNGAGTVADISTEDDRAMYMSLWSIAPLNGPVTGPLIGGFVYQYLGWQWDIWLVLILTGVAVLLMATVQETYGPAVLRKKAALRRKEEDDERYWCEYDDSQRSTLDLLRTNLSRPFMLSAKEPILWFFNLWISVVYGILYLVRKLLLSHVPCDSRIANEVSHYTVLRCVSDRVRGRARLESRRDGPVISWYWDWHDDRHLPRATLATHHQFPRQRP